MIVVADASPLQYLVRIKAIDVLPPLYQRVSIPYQCRPRITAEQHTGCGARLDRAATRLV
jgi:predicted nucleic acid-binding protein